MKYRILVIDDSSDDLFFFKKALSATGLEADLLSIEESNLGLEAIRASAFDCVFMDYNMPGTDGLGILKTVRLTDDNTPIVMLTGQKDEKTIVELMREGATDYLSKDSLSPESLRISIENARKVFLMRQEKKQAEEALRKSEARLAEAQKIGHIGNWEFSMEDRSFFISDEASQIMEAYNNRQGILLNISRRVHRKDFKLFKAAVKQLLAGKDIDITIRFFGWNQSEKCLHIKGKFLFGKGIGTVQDVTVLKKALLEKQKATAKNKATRFVLMIAIAIFLLSEAILDPFIDSLTASLLISLSFKGSIAVALKPVETILERIMVARIVIS
jgi:DNA-binding response OmpR family regulator